MHIFLGYELKNKQRTINPKKQTKKQLLILKKTCFFAHLNKSSDRIHLLLEQ